MLFAAVAVAAFFLTASGCATPDQYTTLRRDALKNDEGHVVGERESLRNQRTGEVIERIEVYVLLVDADGGLVGYEQRLKGRSVVRDSDGRPIGSRVIDLRGQGSNPRSAGPLLLY